MTATVVLDVDGTLVDTNYQHAIAWHRAFREHGYRVAIWAIHRHIGMGGDHLVGSLLGEEGEYESGDDLGEVGAVEVKRSIAALREAGAGAILALAR
jgi:beta-phosphoglucomutase-like phosphatase (HAD superfamily)